MISRSFGQVMIDLPIRDLWAEYEPMRRKNKPTQSLSSMPAKCGWVVSLRSCEVQETGEDGGPMTKSCFLYDYQLSVQKLAQLWLLFDVDLDLFQKLLVAKRQLPV